MPEIKIKRRIISENTTLLDALKLMDSTGFRSLLVLNATNKFKGILSIGDIQRAIIKDNKLETHVIDILRKNPLIANNKTPFEEIKEIMIKFRMEFLPIINSDNEVETVYFWEDLFDIYTHIPLTQFDVPVVIMAGGFGTRLKPLTNVLPKPLIPIGEKTILEDIFERFSNHGCNTFYVSVNYKAELIEYYIQNQKLPYTIHFFKEEKPMGTAGSLSLLKEQINNTFFVSNCDILIEQDYSDILEYHRSNNNEITIVAALKHYPLAYGTIETGENGRLLKLVEKPELTFKINSGMYILESHLLKDIPENEFFHITQLIDQVLDRKGNVGVFPVSQKSWKDLGSWEEYQNYIQ
ncbi:MAG: nucleotidyltransferase family protein [Bacteroidota bacterium]